MFVEPQIAHSSFSNGVDTVKGICETLAILAGGAWTYLNYFRGRVYKPRLECSVDASVEKHSGHPFLRISARVRNIGLSRVPIQQEGTALLIYSASIETRTPSFPSLVRWNEPVAAFDVFTGQKWVEPSEPLAESLMVALPHGNALTHKVALKVVSGEIWWTAETIVGDT
jgi:hypothetical protein